MIKKINIFLVLQLLVKIETSFSRKS